MSENQGLTCLECGTLNAFGATCRACGSALRYLPPNDPAHRPPGFAPGEPAMMPPPASEASSRRLLIALATVVAVLVLAGSVATAFLVSRWWRSQSRIAATAPGATMTFTTSETSTPTTTTTNTNTMNNLTRSPFTYGTSPCPPTDGSATRTLTFASAPANCLIAGQTYTATFDTTAGKVVAALDTTNTPGTVNNFVFLARYHFYDNTNLFRANTAIDIIQGGSPHTQTNSDPGPGYALKDEGMFNADASVGGYKYRAGDLVMARAAGANSGGAQFFFVTGSNGSLLNSQGTYVVFGHVTQGLEALQQIVSTAKVDSSGEGTPNPDVTVQSVTITQG